MILRLLCCFLALTELPPIRKHVDSGSVPATPSRIHSLDGLRAVSILLVLLGHLNGTRNFGNFRFWFGDIAHLGVVVFFVISGFLITSLLAKEYQRTGRVALARFYARRALRILPPSLAYLTLIGILSLAGLILLPLSDVIHALTLTVNYAANRSWYIGHLWSLCVEEQFYLLWPFAFAFSGRRRGLWIAAAGVMLGPVARFATWYWMRGTPFGDLPTFPTVADSLAAGCLLAFAVGWLEHRKWYLALFRPVPSACLLAVVLLTNRYMDFTVVRVVGSGMINLALAVLIHRSVYFWRDPAGRFLNWKPVVFCGKLSYSVYVWQQLFLNRASGSWAAAFPQNVVLAFGVALMSYYLLERPFVRLRGRLESGRRGISRIPALAGAVSRA